MSRVAGYGPHAEGVDGSILPGGGALNPGAALELGKLPHRARPRVASAGGAGIDSPSVERDPVEGPFRGEAAFAAARRDRGRDEPRSLRKARGACSRLGSLHFKTDMIVSSRV
jgi:hypothetical protein